MLLSTSFHAPRCNSKPDGWTWAFRSRRTIKLKGMLTYNDREGYTKVVQKGPIPFQFLVVTQLRKEILISFFRRQLVILHTSHLRGEMVPKKYGACCDDI